MANHFHPFHSVWVVDFEYRQREGENPEPWCAVGLNLVGGEQRVWRCAGATHAPVYTAGPCDLVVAFAAEAEGGCIRALGWPMPAHCIDLRALFLAEANTFGLMPRGSLLEALAHYNLPGMATVEKDAMRELAIRGAPFTTAEMADLVGYCREDVMATARLLGKLWNGKVALPHALLMGRYTLGAVSAMERTGIPGAG